MISILIVSAILFVATKIIHKDKELVEFTGMLALVIVPAIVSLLINFITSAFALPSVFLGLGLVVAVIVVFFFSNSMFEWGYKKSGILAGVYLIASVVVQVLFMTLSR